MNMVCPLCHKQHEADHRLGFPVILCPKMPPGLAVMAPTSDPPERLCSRCGLPESATEWDSLFDVRVVTRAGEEGFSDLTQLLCDRHAVEVVDGLKALGFKDHRHGGTNSLEDLDCPGAGFVVGGACPTPLEADPYDGSHVLGQPR